MFNRRFACLFLGLWLGASCALDLLVTASGYSVDRFAGSPGNQAAASEMKQAGATLTKFILRRAAAEENAFLLEIWDWSQLAIGGLFFLMILFGERPPVSVLAMVPAMLIIVLLQFFILNPHVVSLSRDLDEIPARELVNNPIVASFTAFRGVDIASEVLKLVLGGLAGARLIVRRSHDRSPREVEAAAMRDSARESALDRRARKRRKADING